MAEAGDKDSSEADKPAVSFKTEGDFLKAVEKKATPRIKEAAEKAVSDVLARLGVDNIDAVDGIKDALSKHEGTKSEAEKVKAEADKTAKALRSLEKRNAELETFRTSHLKERALLAHASKTIDIDTVTQLLSPKLTVGDDGAVSAPDNKSVEDAIEALLEAKPHLRASGQRSGPGTSAKPPKAPASNGQSAGPSSNGQKRLSTEQLAANFAAALTAAGTGANHP